MNVSIRSLLAGSLSAVLCAAAFAQSGGGDGGKPAPGQEKGKPAEAVTPKAGAMAPVSVPVTGVTPSNAAALTTALEAVVHPVWKCPACSAVECAKGTCKACNKEMVEDKNAKAFREVKLDPTVGTVSFALAPGQTLRMSALENALKPNGVSIDGKRIAITNYTKLHIKAPADAKETVQKALTDSKLVSNAAARVDEKSNQIVVLVETRSNPTQADIAAALEKAGKDFKLTDVEWTAPCAGCAKTGCMQANCKGCWHDAG